VDWDWEDGPPQDTPQGAPRDDRRPPGEPPQDDAPDSPTFADAIEHFDRSAPAPGDDERTQLIKMPADSGAAPPDEPPLSRADLERPRLRTIEAAQRATAANAAAYSADQESPGELRPRPPRASAAARARRRKQIRRRRLVALAVIVIIVVLIVVLVVRGCGGSTKSPTALIPRTSTVALSAPAASQPLRMAAVVEGRRLPAFTGQL
jgi:hypothetical protein